MDRRRIQCVQTYNRILFSFKAYAIAPAYLEDSIHPISQSVIGEETPDPAKMGSIE